MAKKSKKVEEKQPVIKRFRGTFPAQVSAVVQAESKEQAVQVFNSVILSLNLVMRPQITALAEPAIEEME